MTATHANPVTPQDVADQMVETIAQWIDREVIPNASELEHADEFPQAMFDQMNEFGLFGGDPFGALIGDYEFGKGAQDVELLSQVSQVAAAAHAPFLSAAGPQMFGMDSFTQMPDPRDIAKIFDKNNPENTNSRIFIVMLGDADLVYSCETGTISSVVAGSTQPQTQDSSKR